MSENDQDGWGKGLRKLEEKLNRSTVVAPGNKSEFTVSFRDISHPTRFELEDKYDRSETKFCKVEFIITRGNQDFKFPIFIKTDSVDPAEYIKEAAHRLHLDLMRLAEQTKHFKLREEEAPEPEPDATDILFL